MYEQWHFTKKLCVLETLDTLDAAIKHKDMILCIKDELNGLEEEDSADELWDFCLKKYTNHGLPRFLVNLGKKWGVSKELEEVVRKEADAFSRE